MYWDIEDVIIGDDVFKEGDGLYRVMIVEDEEPVRSAICKIIKWEELGFELVYVASDGQEALSFIENNEVDIIFTDICMPFMDGLELSNKAKKIIPTVKVVIITGYNEFEYAQQAVELGVAHYLLKPITADEFNTVLENVKLELDEEFESRRSFDKLKKQVQDNQKVLKEKFLMNLVTNKIPETIIKDKIEHFKIALKGDECIVAVLQSENLDSKESQWSSDYQLLEFAILNICNEILNKYNQNECIIGNDDQLITVFINKETSHKAFREMIEIILNQIILYVKRFYDVNMFIGLGDSYSQLEDIHFSYQDALTALEYRVLKGSGKIIYKTDLEKKSSFTYQKAEEVLQKLEYAIKIGPPDKINHYIDYIFSIVRFSDVSISDFRTILLSMTTAILKAYGDIKDETTEDVIIDFNLFNEVFKKEKIDEVKAYYKELCDKLAKEIKQKRHDDQTSFIKKAIEHIHNHYSNKDFDVNSICEYLGLSPSYFSRIFKNETSETFVEYLTKIRMDKAKDLLIHSNLKVYEISEKIGYEDPHYFSYNFKKKTGLKPTEYRKKERINLE